MATKKTQKTQEFAVLVTTSHRGVFFGYATETSGPTIKLRRCRNCLYWRNIKGFLALAESGPTKDCRVGHAVDVELRDITSVSACTPEAVIAWEKAPW